MFEGGRKESNRQDGRKRWAAAARFALAVSLSSSQNDLPCLDIGDENNILNRTKNAVITLQDVLEGKHDKIIDDSLQECRVPRERWWLSLYKIVEGKDLQLKVDLFS